MLFRSHGHDGTEPVVWLDVLDLPLVHYMEASYHLNGERQTTLPGNGDRAYSRGGLLPTPVLQAEFGRNATPSATGRGKAYPLLRYPWADARAALLALAEDQPDRQAVQLTYANPKTGGHAENILGFYALMLRPGQTLALPVRSPAMVFHVIEGGVQINVGGEPFSLAQADTCCAPGYTPITLANASASATSFLFIADETPLHQKLGVFETRG